MPKRGHPDFKKKKEHAGKKRPKPENFTNTNVKHGRLVVRQQRAIALGQQEATEEAKATEAAASLTTPAEEQQPVLAPKKTATTHRGLNVDDLLSRFNSSSAAMRQEAVFGLRELAMDHPSAVAARLGAVLEHLA